MNSVRQQFCAGKNAQQGFSLIEMIIAMLLGLFMMASVIEVFSASKSGYLQQESLARLQENGRMAVDVLSREIQLAGFYGCASERASLKSHLRDPENFFWNIQRPMEGFDARGRQWSTGTADAPRLGDELGNKLVAGSDVLNIRYFDPDSRTPLDENMASRDSAVSVESRGNFKTGDIAAVASCVSSEVFQVTAKSSAGLAHVSGVKQPGNSSGSLDRLRKSDVEMPGNVGGDYAYKVVNRSYYVAVGTSGQPGLFRTNARGSKISTVELVEGVEQLQLVYGIDSLGDGKVDQLKPAQMVDFDRDRIVLVEMHLLVRAITEFAQTPDNEEYDLDADGRVDFTAPGDYRLRRVVHTSVVTPNLASLAFQ